MQLASRTMRETGGNLLALFAMLGLLVAALAAATPASATTEHCPDHASAPVKIEADGWASGSFDLDGSSVWYEVDGDTVVFTDEAGQPVDVEFCVKAGTGTSGVITGSSYAVDFENGGGQTPAISYVAVYAVVDETDGEAEVDIDALILTSMCVEEDGTNRFRVRNSGDVDIAAGLLSYDVYGTAESGVLGALAAGEDLYFTTQATGSVTVRLFLDGELAETKASNSTPCEAAVEAVAADLNVVTADAAGQALGGVKVRLAAAAEGVVDELVTNGATGAVTFTGLAEGAHELTVISAPGSGCDLDGALTVTVAADGSVNVTDDDVSAGIGIASWTAATNTVVVEITCETGPADEAVLSGEAQAEGEVQAGGQGAESGPEAGQDQGVLGGTGTPGAGTLPDTAVGGSGSLAPLLVTLLTLSAIGGHSVIGALRRRR